MADKTETLFSGFDVYYKIVGSEAYVSASIEKIMLEYHPAGYSTSFGPVVESGPNEICVSGHRYRSCD